MLFVSKKQNSFFLGPIQPILLSIRRGMGEVRHLKPGFCSSNNTSNSGLGDTRMTSPLARVQQSDPTSGTAFPSLAWRLTADGCPFYWLKHLTEKKLLNPKHIAETSHSEVACLRFFGLQSVNPRAWRKWISCRTSIPPSTWDLSWCFFCKHLTHLEDIKSEPKKSEAKKEKDQKEKRLSSKREWLRFFGGVMSWGSFWWGLLGPWKVETLHPGLLNGCCRRRFQRVGLSKGSPLQPMFDGVSYWFIGTWNQQNTRCWSLISTPSRVFTWLEFFGQVLKICTRRPDGFFFGFHEDGGQSPRVGGVLVGIYCV